MSKISAIEWTDGTWNPWHGCIKVSPGCKNCYMYRDKARYGQKPMEVVRSKPATFNAPLKWKEPRMIFTCSWSDFFIEEADQWRDDAWDIIRQTPQHTYQILTKRPELIRPRLPKDWGDGYKNVWLGVSVEDQLYADIRVPYLLQIPAYRRFLSMEPLIGPIDLVRCHSTRVKLNNWPAPTRVDWVIVGGESGPGYRQINSDWACSIRDQCKAAGVPFFFKQMSGIKSKMQPIPDDLQIREMPE